MLQSPSATSNEILIPKAFSFLRQPKRYKVLYGGRGGAKSHNIARTLITMGMESPLRIICAREIQKSIEDSVHALLSDIIKQSGLEWFYDIQKTKIIGLNGTEIKYRGLKHNITDMKSLEGADKLWIEEAENVSNKSYEIVIPTVRKEGSEIWISFNPKNPTDPTWIRFVQKQSDRIIAKKVSWRDNPFFPSVLEDERLELLKDDPEAYEHVWEGEFDTRYSGKVYAKQLAKIVAEGRLNERVQYDPNFPVYTAWDLGYGDSTAIIFYQVGGGEVFIIDYYETNLEAIKHYAEVLYGREIIVDERELDTGEVVKWHFGEDLPEHVHRKEWRYQACYLPHDSKYETLAANGRSIIGQLKKFEVPAYFIEATSDRNRHEASWTTIPKIWVNSNTCQDLVSAMMNYFFPYDEDRQAFLQKPYHDWSSHGCSAFELLSRIFTDKNLTVKELERKDVVNKFNRLRNENNLEKRDPYRMRGKRK